MNRLCKQCKAELPIWKNKKAEFCDNKCRMKSKYSWRKSNQPLLRKADIGSCSEFLVSVKLFQMGYQVFRALSNSASCDLIIMKNDKIFRIEVRTGYERNKDKKIFCSNTHMKCENFDILAICLPERIVFQPDLPA